MYCNDVIFSNAGYSSIIQNNIYLLIFLKNRAKSHEGTSVTYCYNIKLIRIKIFIVLSYDAMF